MSVYKISESAFLATLWACIGIQCLFLLTRFILRLKIGRRWLAEDIFVLIGWLLSLGNTCLWTIVYKQMYFVIQTSRAQTSDIQFPENIGWVTTRYLRSQLAGYYLSYLSLWSIKLSFLFLFYRFGNKHRLQRILWWTVPVLVIVSLGGCLGMLDYGCLAGSYEDSLANCSSPHAVWYANVSLRVATALDIITDAAIILLSGNSLWRTRITGRKKLALVGISLLTAFIIIIALIRLLLGQSGSGVRDPAWLAAWNAVEILVAIIVACLASFWTLYTKSKQSKGHITPRSFRYRTDNTSMEAPILLEDRNATEDQSIMLHRRLDALEVSASRSRERL